MTIKERMVEAIRTEGYDFITACGLFDQALKEAQDEFKASNKEEIAFVIGKQRIIFKRKKGR